VNKLIPALILVALVAPGLAFMTHSGTSSIHSNELRVYTPQEVNSNFTTLQLFSSNPDVTFPLLSKISSGSFTKVVSYGFVEKLTFPSSRATDIASEISLASKMGGSLSYLNTTTPFIPYVSYFPSQSSSGYYTPQNIYQAYSFNSSNAEGITGNGTSIAIVDAYGDPLLQYDISAFDNLTGLPPVQLQTIYMNNTPNAYNQSWAVETALDVEWAHASAPGAKIILVITQDAQASLTDALSYVISRHVSSIISLSWGQAEASVGSSSLNSENSMFRLAAQDGITVLAASGDLGAYDGTKSLNVNFPASDPYVLGVGGTSLDYNNGKYVETAWGGNQSGSSYGSGGGVSKFFDSPYWQISSNINMTARGVPDVSAVADKNTGVLLIAGGKTYVAGGTSLATPIWAGIVSRMEQHLGYPIGYLNPVLYQIYRSPLYKTAFDEVTSGGNGYYTAGPGWNPVTGLGSPIVSGLISAVAEIKSDYGSMVKFDSGYAFSSLNGTLSIPDVAQSNLSLNGTVFYYLSMYYSSTSYLRFGIALNSSGVYDRFSEVDGSVAYSDTKYLGSLKSNISLSYKLELDYNGSYATTGLNGALTGTYPIMQAYSGSSAPALGVEIINPVDNLTVIPDANFSSVALLNSSGISLPLKAYQMHYSGIAGDSRYSTINIAQNGTDFFLSSGNNTADSFLDGATSAGPCIIYSTVYSSHPTLTFNLSTPETVLYWKVNGSDATSNVIQFTNPGIYNVTADFEGGNVSREVVVPRILKSDLRVYNHYPFYIPQVSYVVDHSLNGNGLIGSNLSIYGFSGINTLSVNASGYYQSNISFAGGSKLDVNLTPANASISIFVFAGNSSVNLNGSILIGRSGFYHDSVMPGTYFVNVSAPGFYSRNSTYELSPGHNYSFQYILIPTEQVYSLQGIITDAVHKFPIQGVEVSSGGKIYGYSNDTGFYEIFAPPGSYNFTFSKDYYNSTIINEHLTSNLTENVGLFPTSVNVSEVYLAGVSFFFPIGYLSLYVSWTLPSQPGVSEFRIDYSTNANMSGFSYVVVPATSSYTILFPVTPAATYYVQVLSILASNQIVASKIFTLNAVSLPDVLINIAMYVAIITYLVVAVRILRRAFKKKKIV